MRVLYRAVFILLAGAGLCIVGPSSAHVKAGEAAAVSPTPVVLNGPVTDLAAILSPEQRGKLASDIAKLEQRTKHQVAIATVASLNGRDIASYARDLGNDAAIGSEHDHKGVVILLAPNQQLVRIAVGRGLEAVLTDALCQQIIDEVMLPQFRDGKMFDGLSGAIGAISAKL